MLDLLIISNHVTCMTCIIYTSKQHAQLALTRLSNSEGVESRTEYASILDHRLKLAGFQQLENAQIAKMMVLSEMQLASSLSELDAQDKSPPEQSSTNSGWDKVLEYSGASQDEEEQEDAMRIELQNYLK